MKPKTLIPFLIVLVILGALALWRRQSERTPSIVTSVKLETVVPAGLQPADLAKVEFYLGSKPDKKVVLEREADTWVVRSQFNAPVNKDNLDKFLKTLLAVKGEFRNEAASDEDLGTYQLKDDQAFHILAYKKDTTEPVVHLLFGKAPDYKTVFFRTASDKRIYLEGTNLRQEAGVYSDAPDAEITADKWLDKSILKLDQEKIAKVEITMPDKSLLFEKQTKEVPVEENASGNQSNTDNTSSDANSAEKSGDQAEKPKTKTVTQWVLTRGGMGSYKESGWQAYLRRFTNLMATSIVDPSKKAEYGLEPATFKVALTMDDGKEHVLEGGRPAGSKNGYVRVAGAASDVVYELSEFSFNNIFPKGSELFTLPKLTVDREKVARIEITQPEGKIVAEKSGDSWRVLEPTSDLPVQNPTLNAFTAAVASLQAADYAEQNVDPGAFTRVARIFTDNAVHTIEVAGDSKCFDGAYARFTEDNRILALNRVDINRLFPKPRDVFDLTLLKFPSQEVKRIEVSRAEGSFAVEADQGVWTLTRGGESVPANRDAVDDLISALNGFQAADLRLGVQDLSQAPEVTISLRLENGTTHELRFGTAEDGGVRPFVYVGKKPVLETDQASFEKVQKALTAVYETPKTEVKETAPAPEGSAQPSTEATGTPGAGEAAAPPSSTAATPSAEVHGVPEGNAAVSQAVPTESASQTPTTPVPAPSTP